MSKLKAKKGEPLKVVRMRIADLITDPSNARLHDEENIKAIEGSLTKFGQQKPIVVKGNVVFAGNGTLMAAKRLGWPEIDAIETNLPDDQLRAFAIADNRTNELSEWDFKELANQLRDLKGLGIDLAAIGWADYQVDPLLAANWDPPAAKDSVESVVPIALTREQRAAFDIAFKAMKAKMTDGDKLTEGRCVQLLAEHYLS